jgi:hypothetical protein
MRNSLLVLGIVLAGLLSGRADEGREVARACSAFLNRPRTTCCALVIEKGTVLKRWIHDSTVTSEEVLGPYLKDYQELVGPQEAPVRMLATSSGWKVVVSWGFPSEEWVWPRFVLYFLAPDGKLRLREEGESLLDGIEAGRLFKTLTELVLVNQQGSHSFSARMLVWVLPLESAPRLVLNTSARGARIETGAGGRPPGISTIGATATGPARSDWKWEPVFWAWDETTKSFRK